MGSNEVGAGIFAVTKFRDGAWIGLVLTPALAAVRDAGALSQDITAVYVSMDGVEAEPVQHA